MLQLANALGVIASNGLKTKPHLVREVVDVVTRGEADRARAAGSDCGQTRLLAVIRHALVD
jgi:penicillin-binding protein 2